MENLNVITSGPAGNKPRNERRQQRRGAAGPRRVLESHPQNQDPAGADGEDHRQLHQPALGNTHQVL